MPQKSKQDRIWIRDESRKEYQKSIDVFRGLLEDLYFFPEEYIVHEELMQQRASQILNFAFLGYGLKLEEALKKIKDRNSELLTTEEIRERRMLLDVFENLVRFGMMSQYTMLGKLRTQAEDVETLDEFEEEAEEIFERYNFTYASVENDDAHFIMSSALAFSAFGSNSVLTFMTQGDERVRDDHRALEGISYLKSQFPTSFQPPIDWGCRCFLLESWDFDLLDNNPPDVDQLIANVSNPIFSQTPWSGGVVFGNSHDYFNYQASHANILENTFSNLVNKFGV